jgi:hypothetical protein
VREFVLCYRANFFNTTINSSITTLPLPDLIALYMHP